MKEGIVNIMKQLELNLEWLSDNWIPKKVVKHIGMSNDAFDEMQSKLYGYESVTQMNAHNYSKDMQNKLNYGDKYKGLI